MPELPEVETIRTQLEPRLVERRIESGWGFDSPKFTDAPRADGLQITALRRRGKYLLADLSGPGRPKELIVHLGMTGRLRIVSTAPSSLDTGQTRIAHLRASWSMSDGEHLALWDQRRFGRVAVVDRGDHANLPTLHRLGPEPFSAEFTPARLREGLRGRRALKTVLLDQRLVAGVGNIYADEALWLAGIRPSARRLGATRAEDLHAALIEVLSAAIGDGGTTLRDYRDADGSSGTHQNRLLCYGRAGQGCVRCGDTLRRAVIDGRGTTWCAICQH